MTTTNKNLNYYRDVLVTPCYLLRNELEEHYCIIQTYGINTLEYFAMIAEQLTAYNEISCAPLFFRMRDFKPSI